MKVPGCRKKVIQKCSFPLIFSNLEDTLEKASGLIYLTSQQVVI